MGLDVGFKSYIAATFPRACVRVEPAAVVLDVSPSVHALAIPTKPGQEPADITLDRILSFVASKAAGVRHAAFCFDNSAATPFSKHVELGKRNRGAPQVTPEALAAMLDAGTLTDMHAIISSRGARELLFERIAQGLLDAVDFDTVLVLGSGEPRVGGCDPQTPLPASKTMHGEADISCIYAAHLLAHHGVVEIRTVDTDLVALAMLAGGVGGAAPQAPHVSLTYQSTTLDINTGALRDAMCSRYNLNAHELVLALFSRGTDYVDKSITFLPDWDDYMTRLAAGMRRGQAPLASAAGVVLGRLHEAMVSASASKQRSKLKFMPHDGHLLRLAWQLLYSARGPLGGGEGLDPADFGWAVRGGETVRVPSQRWGAHQRGLRPRTPAGT